MLERRNRRGPRRGGLPCRNAECRAGQPSPIQRPQVDHLRDSLRERVLLLARGFFGGRDTIANAESIGLARRLAWTDVANAAAWLGVVAVLEADLWMKLRGSISPGFDKFSKISKIILYGTLFAAAIQWQLEGGFVDAWDAYLWLIAFVFIEMNFFTWQEEEATD